MTDVPDIVLVSVVAPICNSDHSSLTAVISIAQSVPSLCVSRKVFLKHQGNMIQSVVQYRICRGITFSSLTMQLWF